MKKKLPDLKRLLLERGKKQRKLPPEPSRSVSRLNKPNRIKSVLRKSALDLSRRKPSVKLSAKKSLDKLRSDVSMRKRWRDRGLKKSRGE